MDIELFIGVFVVIWSGLGMALYSETCKAVKRGESKISHNRLFLIGLACGPITWAFLFFCVILLVIKSAGGLAFNWVKK